jgi:hypothetical protein
MFRVAAQIIVAAAAAGGVALSTVIVGLVLTAGLVYLSSEGFAGVGGNIFDYFFSHLNNTQRDPLVLDLDGDGIELSSLENSTVHFDYDADGFAERTGWVSSDDGILVVDANANSAVDGAGELFGSPTQDGFAVLDLYDSNGDGKIDANDAAWAQLRVWQDADQDGVSDAGELRTLADAGVKSISLARDDVAESLPILSLRHTRLPGVSEILPQGEARRRIRRTVFKSEAVRRPVPPRLRTVPRPLERKGRERRKPGRHVTQGHHCDRKENWTAADRIVEAASDSLVRAYEKRVQDLETQKALMQERIAVGGRPLKNFGETYRTAFDFLANPCKIWHSPRIENRRAVLKLVFADRLAYARNEGYRTAKISTPFKLLGDMNMNKNEMVPRGGIEPPTRGFSVRCSTN